MHMGTRKIAAISLALTVLLIAFFSIFQPFPTDLNGQNSIGIECESREAMDTIVTVEIVSRENSSKTALDLAFNEIERIEKLMSTYREESEISRLNREGYLLEASPDLVHVIDRSIYYSEISGGAFDITILPMLMLWKTKINSGEYPTDQEINDTLALVNYSNITLENNSIALRTDGMAITLGGVAKGYAVDEAVAVLKKNGYNSGFVNAGGDGMYFGTKPDGSPWKVGLRNPDNKTDTIAVLNISDMAVTTSGNYERYFNESARLSHISDPRSGHPSQSLMSATIIATSALEADALATAVFVLGPVEGMNMVERTEGTECLLITPDRNVLKSTGFKAYEVE